MLEKQKTRQTGRDMCVEFLWVGVGLSMPSCSRTLRRAFLAEVVATKEIFTTVQNGCIDTRVRTASSSAGVQRRRVAFRAFALDFGDPAPGGLWRFFFMSITGTCIDECCTWSGGGEDTACDKPVEEDAGVCSLCGCFPS